jgi:hypothetical protein
MGKKGMKKHGRMAEENTVKKVFENIPEGKGFVDKPRKRWLADAEYDLKNMNFKEWRKIGEYRGKGKVFSLEA